MAGRRIRHANAREKALEALRYGLSMTAAAKARRPSRCRKRHHVEHSGVLRVDQVMRELYGEVIEGIATEAHSIEGPDDGR